MILSESVDVYIIPKILKYYIELGYNVKVNQILKVKMSDLSKKSTIKIKVKCDVCGNEKYLPYQKYTKSISSYGYYSCSQKCSVGKCKNTFIKNYGETSPLKNNDIKEKSKNTCKLKYDKEYFFQTDDFKEKSKNTSLIKYNTEHPMKSNLIKKRLIQSLLKKYGVTNSMYNSKTKEKVKLTKIKNGIISSDNDISELKLYKRIIKNITYKNKKILFNNWNGYDYYDNEYIKENLSLHCLNKSYPTIDHKISVLYGFLNNIDHYIIGDIDNLCITKKGINSSKKEKNEKDFYINKN